MGSLPRYTRKLRERAARESFGALRKSQEEARAYRDQALKLLLEIGKKKGFVAVPGQNFTGERPQETLEVLRANDVIWLKDGRPQTAIALVAGSAGLKDAIARFKELQKALPNLQAVIVVLEDEQVEAARNAVEKAGQAEKVKVLSVFDAEGI